MSRLRYSKYNNETERVRSEIDRSPLELEPLRTDILVYPGYWDSSKEHNVSKEDFTTYKDN